MTKAISLDLTRGLGRQRVPDIIARIKDSYGALRPAEQLVADAVLSNVQMAVDASNAGIASRAGVCQPTVTRFCRAIGCDGVRDFKLKLARSLVVGDVFLAAASAEDLPEFPLDSAPPFLDSVFGEARRALREVERQLDPELVLRAADAIAAAGRVTVFGVGAVRRPWPRKPNTGCFATACRSPRAKIPIWRG